jgi:hypothetical protein
MTEFGRYKSLRRRRKYLCYRLDYSPGDGDYVETFSMRKVKQTAIKWGGALIHTTVLQQSGPSSFGFWNNEGSFELTLLA